eukprot:gb/GECG01001152.1/.p1 GENE.gb/GECG01001152.1/~~gb/GECG01001152.1/.p1  ORF type:complete len:532 (+),score=55.03 gb/GECG01001152.1/:1-1596(+)
MSESDRVKKARKMSHSGEAILPKILGDYTHPETIRFLGTQQMDQTPGTHVFIGLKENLVAPDIASMCPVVETGEVAALLKQLHPGRDGPATIETTKVNGNGSLQRCVLVALPTDCSRHNTSSRSHAITNALCKMSLGLHSFPLGVTLMLNDHNNTQASALAVARAFPAYNHRSTRGSFGGIEVLVNVNFVGDAKGSTVDKDETQILIASTRLCAALVDMPTSELHTDRFVEIAQTIHSEVGGTNITVISGEALRDKGFGGHWGVGKASEHLPAFVVLEYCPKGVSQDSPAYCFAGKGIVYDTGGLSIKGKDGMPGMKRDMGGAAASLGAFRSLALSGKCKSRICCLLCLSENSVSKESTRPDDILTLYSGKTVEVNNTDAEGRLVLGDGVAYAVKHLNPRCILDIATLTGAQGISTGQNHGALYCNDDDLEAHMIKCGKHTGDLVHPLPFAPEFYRKEFGSPVADMKNSVANRSNAQSSCAGQFIGNHLGTFLYHGKWCHIDIASPAFSGGLGTGFGVGLLYTALTSMASQ